MKKNSTIMIENSVQNNKKKQTKYSLLEDNFICDESEIANMMEVSLSKIATIIARYKKKEDENKLKFPQPVEIRCGKKYYSIKEVKKWYETYKIIFPNIRVSSFGEKKEITLIGGPGVGKSCTSMLLAEEAHTELVSRKGAPYTQSRVKLIFRQDTEMDCVRIISKNTDFEPEFRAINKNTLGYVKRDLDKYNDYLKEKKEKYDSKSEYIEYYLKPSKYCTRILKELNISQLEIFDTPGIDSEHGSEFLVNTDMIIFFLADRSNVDNINQSIKPILPYCTAASPILYIYSMPDRLLDPEKEDDFINLKKEIRTGKMMGYAEKLIELKGSKIILNSSNVFSPQDNCIPLPMITSKETPKRFFKDIKFFEEIFMEEFTTAIIKSFQTNSLQNSIDNFDASNKDEFKYFEKIIKLEICKLNDEFLNNQPQGFYTNAKNEFIKNKHYRTKTKDGYIIVGHLYNIKNNILQILYKNFEKYESNEYNNSQSRAIILAYHVLVNAVKRVYNYGYGNHQFEDSLCETQMIEEEILARDIITIIENPSLNDKEKYINILQKNNIMSDSWNCVHLNKNICSTDKLKIICDYNLDNCDSLKDLESLIYSTHFCSYFAIEYMKTVFKINGEKIELSDYNTRKEIYDKILLK